MARRGEVSKEKVREMAHRAGGIKRLPEKAGHLVKKATVLLTLIHLLGRKNK